MDGDGAGGVVAAAAALSSSAMLVSDEGLDILISLTTVSTQRFKKDLFSFSLHALDLHFRRLRY